MLCVCIVAVVTSESYMLMNAVMYNIVIMICLLFRFSYEEDGVVVLRKHIADSPFFW